MKEDYTTIKSLIISNVIELISSQFKISLDEARDIFYKSETIKLIKDEETGLIYHSALYSFSYFEREYKSKNK